MRHFFRPPNGRIADAHFKPPRPSRSYFSILRYAVFFVVLFLVESSSCEDVAVDSSDFSLPLLQDTSYEPAFLGLDRSIIGRAGADATDLPNDQPRSLNIGPGSYDSYRFLLSSQTTSRSTHTRDVDDDFTSQNGSLTARQSQAFAYISINTCQQPASLATQQIVPQLTLYISNTTGAVLYPGYPGFKLTLQLDGGFAAVAIPTTSEVSITVEAPKVTVQNGEVWNYELAASTSQFYHVFDNISPVRLRLIDSDAEAALLTTKELSQMAANPADPASVQALLQNGPPYSVFVTNTNNTAFKGLQKSMCGLSRISPVLTNVGAGRDPNIKTDIKYNPDGTPDERIYVPGLLRSSTYYGVLAQAGNGTASGSGIPGGGGVVFPFMTFTTKRDINCAIIYDLEFCSQVEYAVPANPYRFGNVNDLANLYDKNASDLYKPFNYSLQQIPCNTTSSAQYSLAKGCDDCAEAYKTWLCAVTIPRCEDFSLPPAGEDDSTDSGDLSPAAYLMPRNVAQAPIPGANISQSLLSNSTELNWLATNSSRNNYTVAEIIQAGPYREVLPCEDLCYDLVRNCPAALGFGCPDPGSPLMMASYGVRANAIGGGVTCNAPGVVYGESAAFISSRPKLGVASVALMFCIFMVA